MDVATLLPLFAKHAYQYRPENPFVLSSGATSPEYLDCRQALSEPVVLGQLGPVLGPLVDLKVRAVGGLTMGADPIAVALSLYSLYTERPVRWFSVRKEPKSHGRGRLIEGAVHEGDSVCVLEDVVTSGDSTIKAIRACRATGLEVSQVLALVDRQQGGLENIQRELGSDISVSALFTLDDLRAAARR